MTKKRLLKGTQARVGRGGIDGRGQPRPTRGHQTSTGRVGEAGQGTDGRNPEGGRGDGGRH
jgi:hypothetical protein